MKGRPLKNQSGFALLMFVLVILTAGGMLTIGISQNMQESAENNKFEHNKRVLEEAKRALLQFAYNYPVTNNKGPGRLPCTDIDNDGDANTAFGDCITLGRLPWNEPNLHLYDIRDADGQRLWYAVSDAFATNVSGGNIINSDTSGTITLRDQQGNIIYDGSNPGSLTQYGIAAVIISPGAVINRNGVRQDRSLDDDVSAFDTIADDDPGIVLASNYLDLTSAEDNAGFTNSSATDGFILGPVYDSTNDVYLSNDQFIVITAAEVAEMAEKSAMQAYRTAIEDYRFNTGECTGESPDGATTEADCLLAATPGTWTLGPYPWLYNYAGVTDIADMSSYYPANASWATELATNLTVIGRVPTIFGEYFTENASPGFETELEGYFDISFPTGFNWNDGKDSGVLDHGANYTPDFNFSDVADVQFSNVGGNIGRFTATFPSAQPAAQLEIYYWAEHTTDMKDIDVSNITPCLDSNGDGVENLTDCETSWVIEGGNTGAMRIDVILDGLTGTTVTFDLDYSTAPSLTYTPATATSHAMVWATFPAASVVNSTMPTVNDATFEADHHYHVGFTTLGNDEDGVVTIGDFSLNELTLGVRYYPELPAWAFDNDWHNSMILHYAKGYEPGGTQTCDPLVFDPNTSCIFIRMRDSTATHPWNRDKIAVLLNTAEHGWVDGNTDGDFEDDVDRDNVTDAGNRELDYIMRWKDPGDPDESVDLYKVPPGNDNLLILEEQ